MSASAERVIIVTGASSGIGRAFTERATRAGAAIVAVGRRAAALASLAESVRANGGTIEIHVADVSDPKTAQPIVARALERFGRIDVIFACAGEVAAGPLLAQSDAQLTRQFGTHVIGPLALVRAAVAALRETKGHVIVVGSGVGRVPVGGLGAYPASKAALRSAAVTLRRELAPFGIGLTYVDPGAVDTGFMERAGMASAPKWLMTTPQHVAAAVLRALTSRPRELNAVPYQTAFVALAERFPRLTDWLLARLPALVGGAPAVALQNATPNTPEEIAAAPPALPSKEEPLRYELSPATLEEVLTPLARRMERLNLSLRFVRELLVPGATLVLGDVAMRWAGMPNKNERAVTREVLDALASGGFLQPNGEDRWTVLRSG